MCNQHIFLVKDKASKFSEQCSFIIKAATFQETSKVPKANLLIELYLLGAVARRFQGKDGSNFSRGWTL